MFSLIIVIISIALVAALALATIFYGGHAFNKGSAGAKASQIMLQGQQVMGASDLYRADHGKWPDSMDDLTQPDVEGRIYLKQVPTISSSAVTLDLVGSAYAQAASGSSWTMPEAGKPIWVLSQPVSADVCREVNRRARGDDGILATARTSLTMQCYGPGEGDYTVVAAREPSQLVDVLPPAEVSTDPVPSDPESSEWTVPPGSITPPSSGGGSNPPPGGGDGGNDDEDEGPGSGPSPSLNLVCTNSGHVVAGTGADIWGNSFGVLVWGDDVSTHVPTTATVTVNGLPIASTPATVNPWEAEFTADFPDLAPGLYPVQLHGSGGVVLDCGYVDVFDSYDENDDEEGSLSISVSPSQLSATGGTVVTVNATSGQFVIRNGQKPRVILYADEGAQYHLPDSQVTFVNSTTITFIAPAADAFGGFGPTQASPGILVEARNANSVYAVGSDYAQYVDFPPPPAPPANHNALLVYGTYTLDFQTAENCNSIPAGAGACLPEFRAAHTLWSWGPGDGFDVGVGDSTEWDALGRPNVSRWGSKYMFTITDLDGRSYTLERPDYTEMVVTYKGIGQGTHSCSDILADMDDFEPYLYLSNCSTIVVEPSQVTVNFTSNARPDINHSPWASGSCAGLTCTFNLIGGHTWGEWTVGQKASYTDYSIDTWKVTAGKDPEALLEAPLSTSFSYGD